MGSPFRGARVELTITPIPDEDESRAAALLLLSTTLGAHYIAEQEIADLQAGKMHGMALGAFLDNELVGVLLGRMLEKETAAEYEAQAKEGGATAGLAGQRLGLLQSVAVKPGCRGQGIGTGLSRALLDHLKRAGANAVLAVSWESGTRDSSAGMLEAVGFQRVARVAEFWKGDSLRRGYTCPRCGNPCRCAGVLYLRSM
jgi:ribosomal protein S18 acetylase RimI-like enzyme